MVKGRKLILLLSALIFTAAVVGVASLYGHAQTTPDLSHLDSDHLLNDNRQVFPVPNGNYAVLSTDSENLTYLVFVDTNGNLLDDSNPKTFLFVYQTACVCGNNLYLCGPSVFSGNTLEIYRVRLDSRASVKNLISDAGCDFSRGLYAKPEGDVYLVTGAPGSTFSSDAPFSCYRFSDTPNAVLTGSPAPGFSPNSPETSESSESSESFISSEPSSSESISSSEAPQPSSSGSSSSSIEPFAPAEYRFASPITVTALQEQLKAEGRGAMVRVTSMDGKPVTSGPVGTGCLVEVLLNGQVDSRITAIIPGDLTGSGDVTLQDAAMLWEYCVGRRSLSGLYLKAADLNGDGAVNTSDILKLRNLISDQESS